MMVIAFLVVPVLQLCSDRVGPIGWQQQATPILILLLQLEVLWGLSCGVGNLGVASRSG